MRHHEPINEGDSVFLNTFESGGGHTELVTANCTAFSDVGGCNNNGVLMQFNVVRRSNCGY
jgi:hypothetical protein